MTDFVDDVANVIPVKLREAAGPRVATASLGTTNHHGSLGSAWCGYGRLSHESEAELKRPAVHDRSMRLAGLPKRAKAASLGFSQCLPSAPQLWAGALIMSAGSSAHAVELPLDPTGLPSQTYKNQQEPLAPLGVFGVNLPGPGSTVLTIDPSFVQRSGNLIGTQRVSSDYIVSHIYSDRTPKPGYNLLRVVPTSAELFTQNFRVAHGFSDYFALVVSGSYLNKNIDLLTYKGLAGTTRLGTSVGHTDGIGDTSVAGVYRIYRDQNSRINLNFGLSLPTGSITNEWSPLTPAGQYLQKAAVYGAEEGTGTVDALPGITYAGTLDAWSWGLAYHARVPLDYNVQGWRFGLFQTVDAWAGYSWLPGVETTLRLNGLTQGQISGLDVNRTGYAQGNEPSNYGGQQASVFLGASIAGRYFGLPAAAFEVEAGVPYYQHLNGPQSATQWQGHLALKYKL